MKKLFMVLCVVIMFFGIVGCPTSDDAPRSLNESFIASNQTQNNVGGDINNNIDVTDVTKDTPGGSQVPEPATLILLGSGLVGLAGVGRKKLFKKD